MDRTDLQRLTKEELIELVLRMQRPPTTLAHVLKAALDGSQGASGSGQAPLAEK
jgi:hypothetical protein